MTQNHKVKDPEKILANLESTLLYAMSNHKGQSSCYALRQFNQHTEYGFSAFDNVDIVRFRNNTEDSESFEGIIRSSYARSAKFSYIGLEPKSKHPNLFDILKGEGKSFNPKKNGNPSIVGIGDIGIKSKTLIIASADCTISFLTNDKRTINLRRRNGIDAIHSLITHDMQAYLLAYCTERIPEYRLFRIDKGLTQVASLPHFLSGKERCDIRKYKQFFLTDVSGNQMSLLVPSRYKKDIFEYQRINRSTRDNCIYDSFEVIPSRKDNILTYIATYHDKEGIFHFEFANINLQDQRYNEFREIQLPQELRGRVDHMKLIYSPELNKKIKEIWQE
jgi:hypothetical protein